MVGRLKLACVLFFFSLYLANSALGKVDRLILLNTPISEFTLPVFEGNGNKVWEICGTSATMVGRDLFSLLDAKLHCFAGDFAGGNASSEFFCATSEAATVDSSTHRASGECGIRIVGRNFDATADSWEFLGDSKKIIAKNNVVVFLYENVGELAR
ncbi:MAG: hypothetical protein LBI61_00310 [Puniceicoccales bacterium]|jgi:hypothetical protein|nr:hypothetical protein [Puniceicoccales bacterium]